MNYKHKSAEQIADEIEQINHATAEAKMILDKLPVESISVVATWMNTYYLKAGYKNLGRLLLDKAGYNRIKLDSNAPKPEIGSITELAEV
jgi:hypothetical protein